MRCRGRISGVWNAVPGAEVLRGSDEKVDGVHYGEYAHIGFVLSSRDEATLAQVAHADTLLCPFYYHDRGYLMEMDVTIIRTCIGSPTSHDSQALFTLFPNDLHVEQHIDDKNIYSIAQPTSNRALCDEGQFSKLRHLAQIVFGDQGDRSRGSVGH